MLIEWWHDLTFKKKFLKYSLTHRNVPYLQHSDSKLDVYICPNLLDCMVKANDFYYMQIKLW